ncbi:MAG TPA: hypothetical protein VM347_09080 [Nonomuraea sp.]|nr:hypothetical protein [Nonomuraea sp.]
MPSRQALLRSTTSVGFGLAAGYAVLQLSIALDAQTSLIERYPDGFERWSVAPPAWGYGVAGVFGIALAAWWFARANAAPPTAGSRQTRPIAVSYTAGLMVGGACGSALLGLFFAWLGPSEFDPSEKWVVAVGLLGAPWLVAIAWLMLVGGPRGLVVSMSGLAVLIGLAFNQGPTTSAVAVGGWLILYALSETVSWRAWLSRPLFRANALTPVFTDTP